MLGQADRAFRAAVKACSAGKESALRPWRLAMLSRHPGVLLISNIFLSLQESLLIYTCIYTHIIYHLCMYKKQ